MNYLKNLHTLIKTSISSCLFGSRSITEKFVHLHAFVFFPFVFTCLCLLYWILNENTVMQTNYSFVYFIVIKFQLSISYTKL